MRVYAGEGFLLLLFLFTDKIPLTSGKIILLSLAVYPQETDYPLNNSRQTDNTSLFENRTVLILGEQSAWLFPFDLPSILTDFEGGLFVSSLKTSSKFVISDNLPRN